MMLVFSVLLLLKTLNVVMVTLERVRRKERIVDELLEKALSEAEKEEN